MFSKDFMFISNTYQTQIATTKTTLTSGLDTKGDTFRVLPLREQQHHKGCHP